MWNLCARIAATFLLVVSATAQVSPATSQELLKRAEAADAQAQFELGRAYEESKHADDWYNSPSKTQELKRH